MSDNTSGGLTAWAAQKAANAAYLVASPFITLSDRLDEAAFRATKRHERKGAV